MYGVKSISKSLDRTIVTVKSVFELSDSNRRTCVHISSGFFGYLFKALK